MSEAQQTAIAELLHVVEILFATDTPATSALAIVYLGRAEALQAGTMQPYQYHAEEMAAAQEMRTKWRAASLLRRAA